MALPNESIPAQFLDEPEWWPDFAEELEAGVAVISDKADDDPAVRWSIESDGAAEWAMRRLAELQAKARQISTQADEWRYPINNWETDELKRVVPGIEFFTGHLTRYAIAQREQTGDATLRLPSGSVPTRAPAQPAVHVVDNDALERFLYEHVKSDDYVAAVKIEKTVRVVELRALVEPVPVMLPVCAVCGYELEKVTPTSDLGDEWEHVPVPGADPFADLDHEPEPSPGWRVVLKGRDEQTPVPGVMAAVGPTTATVKVTR